MKPSYSKLGFKIAVESTKQVLAGCKTDLLWTLFHVRNTRVLLEAAERAEKLELLVSKVAALDDGDCSFAWEHDDLFKEIHALVDKHNLDDPPKDCPPYVP